MREQSRQRHDPGRVRQPAYQLDRPASIPRRQIDRFIDNIQRWWLLQELFEIRDPRALSKSRFVDARLKAIFQRHHQFDALQRAESELLERRAVVNRAAA